MSSISSPQSDQSLAVVPSITLAHDVPPMDDHVPLHSAMNSLDADHKLVAVHEEMHSLHQNRAWELIEAPLGRLIITCK